MLKSHKNILWFSQITKKDNSLVGGKNASLGEMYSKLTGKGIHIPDGFSLTSRAYWKFLKVNKIDKELKRIFKKLEPNSLESIQETGAQSRKLILEAEFPKGLEKSVLTAYKKLSFKYAEKNLSVAVRSSATAEDLKTASFAGQHESFLNVVGQEKLLNAVKQCMASLFTDRAIAYREEKGFKKHLKIALSVGVQKMVQSGAASSGVMFTLDTESGFRDVVLLNSIFGVGEMIVKGKITPDQFYIFKPTLENFEPIIVKNLGRKNRKYIYNKKGGLKEIAVSPVQQSTFSLNDKEILTLAKWGVIIEKHYKSPQDIEWAKDSKTGKLFIVQSRPETVHAVKNINVFEQYRLLKTSKKPILRGIAIGDKIVYGNVHKITDIAQAGNFQKGEVLVTAMTDPDWVPLMRVASAIITNEGGKTAHAAIVARELGIPAIVGCGNATQVLKNEQEITVDCAEGLKGRVFEGKLKFEIESHNLKKIPKLKTQIMLNMAIPETAFRASQLPNDGVGLARLEFIIAEKIKAHPMALYNYKKLQKTNKGLAKKIDKLCVEHKNKREYFIKELAEGIGQIAAAFYPKPVIVRLSDFKTNEYRALLGGELFEPLEENPMLGWRGASRYYHPKFKPAFLMELKAIKRARDVFGLKNIKLMVPFCRTVEEGEKVLAIMKTAGLEKHKDGLEVYVMAELPSNEILAKDFLKIFDGMSIGTNDLTQFVLGIDRDSADLQDIGNEENKAVKMAISEIIKVCREKKKYCGVCGQAPSDLPDFANFLVKEGIESISLNPDSVFKTILNLSKK